MEIPSRFWTRVIQSTRVSDEKPIIHDDSHARAILLGIMREARFEFEERYRIFENKPLPKKWNQKAYLFACSERRRVLGDAVIIEATQSQGRGKRKKTVFISLGKR